MKNQDNWLYSKNGSRHGPFTKSQMSDLIDQKKIDLNTSVWPGHGDWVKLKDTSLNNLLPPPPLPESEINNFFIWIAVGLQAIFTFFGNDFSIFHILCVVAILFILSLIDSCLLAKAGHKAPSAFWALWIFPVYVILRGIRIKTRRFYWYAEIFLLLALALALSIPLVTNSNSDIEEASCNLVTNILQNQLNQKTSCIYVSIDSNPQPNVYEATAVLSNTKEVKISIEQKDKPRRLLTVKIKGD